MADSYTLQLGNPDMPMAIQLPSGPRLSITRSRGVIRIAWPAEARGFLLLGSDQLGAKADWAKVEADPQLEGDENVVRLRPEEAARYYKLIEGP